jgi:hypothetical protein
MTLKDYLLLMAEQKKEIIDISKEFDDGNTVVQETL